MAASLLEENLRSLQQYVVDADNVSKDQAVNVISDIQQLCVNEVTEKDIDLCCSVLFDKDKGIITFLNKTVTNDEWQVCKQRILELLSEFLQKVGKKILPYAVDIKEMNTIRIDVDICISLFFRDRFAKIQSSEVILMFAGDVDACGGGGVVAGGGDLMELTVGSSVGKDLDIDKIIVKFFNELSKPSSKLSATGTVYYDLNIRSSKQAESYICEKQQ
ncbi:hypothetical protein KUTeg_003139 [Tegillarca granosa]|uniref:DNA-PKcs N-terminal domain-containing protein n=1 Tax=Tegillarca granosa TaxID=220873 RepID=A0ABQ9FLA0_TEGGR|nr:hypothetical protein KUTeg_003139 [Tegillarca granosa]